MNCRRGLRKTLQLAAQQIAANRGEKAAGAWKAFRKIFLQERRDWDTPGAPHVGWKRGEFVEVLEALVHGGRKALREEWGDVGYYVAQTWWLLWCVYATVTPNAIITAAVEKFTRRANCQ